MFVEGDGAGDKTVNLFPVHSIFDHFLHEVGLMVAVFDLSTSTSCGPPCVYVILILRVIKDWRDHVTLPVCMGEIM